jgi:hypothetical protein
MFFKLGIFGGDKHNEKSLEFLETSLAHGATYAENTTYIAETLMALGNGLMGRLDYLFVVIQANFAIAWMMITMVEGQCMSQGLLCSYRCLWAGFS